jgi:D-mannonate dehydratase
LSPTLPCPETPNYNCNHHYVYQQLFAELQRQASSKESQLFHTIEQLGKDNQVQRIRFNEAYDQVRRLEQKLRAAETRATTLHEQLENERLEHHATREALRIEQAEHQVTAMELPAANWDVQLSRLSDAVDNLQAQQEWFLREGMLARQIHVRSNSDVMLCVHMAESIGLLRIRLDLIRPLPRIVDEHWTRYNETWNQCLLLALGGHSEPSEMHHLWPKLTEQKVGLDSLLMGYLDAYMD